MFRAVNSVIIRQRVREIHLMRKVAISILCIAVGLAFSLSAAQAKEGKVNTGKKLLKPNAKLVKPLAKKAKKGAKGKKASKKTKLFDKLETGKSKNQKYRNAYLLAVLSKLAYQPKSKPVIEIQPSTR